MRIGSEEEMIEYGRSLAQELKEARKTAKPIVIELVGDVGAGKTTLTRGIAEGLGVKDSVTSPSFTISKAYALPDGGRFVHYDFYRLNEPGLMVEDLSENLAEPQNVIVIEWGESVADLLPEDHLRVELKHNDDGSREVIK